MSPLGFFRYLWESLKNRGFLTWISASDTPKSRLETRSFPPVSTPAPAPKPLSKRSCCHFSGSCFDHGPAGRFLPPPRAMTGLFRTGPPPPARPAPTLPRPGPPPRAAPPRPRPPRPPPARPAPRWLRFSLMISSRDMSILSAMMAAPLRGLRGLH
uniref:Uncharacterized protein n=1 Tax=Pelusios castaneus TaxID=367368 RepID=A0A8C8S887_9SAUR